MVAAHAGARRPRVLPGPVLSGLAVFAWLGWEYFWKSFEQNERIVTSPWLPIVWPFKFMMPSAAVLLLLQGVSEFLKCWARAFGPGVDDVARPAASDGEVSI